ncbi:hypothetical protein [Plantactinospora alkalitolerans]|nr:hypothetical protein [Plantactinospora alkalitolerans]
MDRRHTAWIDAQHGSTRALLFQSPSSSTTAGRGFGVTAGSK